MMTKQTTSPPTSFFPENTIHYAHMIVIGHRGACGYEPENTLRSFQKALDLGVDMIELDVQVCKTGELVVIHDSTVDRTTDGHGRISDLPYKTIRSLHITPDEHIPLLSEVFDLIHKKIQINIELKGVGTARPTADIIRAYVSHKGWSWDHFLVSSFSRKRLKEFHHILPEVRIAPVYTTTFFFPILRAKWMGAYAINPNFRTVTKRFITKAHASGLNLFVWTVNEPQDIKNTQALDVDGIISNFPDRIQR
ncbi:MAG: glycerophosphodiester phosphodiesterase family protein [Patescibacteria group bacterium]|jgi:glycerophosphoryl diester phosphodiesterase